MEMLSIAGLLIAIFFSAIFLTWIMMQYAIRKNIMDIPNSRSSHQVSTPRGGGLAIFISYSAGLLYLWVSGHIDTNIFIAIMGAGVLVAFTGFLDDHGDFPRKWRFIVHTLSAVWVLFWVGKGLQIQLWGNLYGTGWPGMLASGFFLVWLLNLFNFMDGIDGLAASETVVIAFCASFLIWFSGSDSYLYILLVLAIATLGFLVWNWSPASIFMGDVGSGFLGIMLGALAYATVTDGVISVWSWLILFGVFMADASITLIRRIFRGECWYNAHRSHAYQHAAQYFKSHRKVTVGVFMINIFWLFPCALYAAINPQWGILIAAIAYTPLVFIAFSFRAGYN